MPVTADIAVACRSLNARAAAVSYVHHRLIELGRRSDGKPCSSRVAGERQARKGRTECWISSQTVLPRKSAMQRLGIACA